MECYCGPGPHGSGFPLTDWKHVSGRFGSAAAWQKFGSQGGWNDLDSLQVGNGDTVGINADQRRSMMTLWAMAASPLILGTDVTKLAAVDLAMLNNTMVLGVDSDGVTARRVVNNGAQQVFAKKESSGAVVVALFNTGTSGNQTVSVSWSQVGLGSNTANVTDLWAQKSGGTVTGTFKVTLRPGETRLIRAVPA